ncbi:glycogen synthase [Agaribacterium sp. ZY112]|uniref:glycogen synthase n=1 Tax=Agaribacterium sp. ZY112 TaxID=3233574 RepID=UPI003525A2AE
MENKKILMVAAENDALPGAKVGGVGDVIRDLPKALVEQGYSVQTIIPSYGMLSRLPQAKVAGEIKVDFAGASHRVLFYRYQHSGVDAWIVHHTRFSPQGETVYCHDGADAPFATDATKFAFFCMAIAEALEQGVIERPDIIHAHDWHAAFLLILMRLAPQFANLNSIRTVYSIHNLAMQGVRPFRGHESSFEQWFPQLVLDPRGIADPDYPHCINPMRAGIVIADKVHTVSPTYAEEIQQASNHAAGIYGGEGLEADLQMRAEQGALFGILNGCDYNAVKKVKPLAKVSFVKLAQATLLSWAAKEASLKTAHWLAEKRLASWAASRKAKMILSSVGRVTEQKMRLLCASTSTGETVLSAMLKHAGNDALLLMVGSGDTQLEQQLVQISAEHENFVFLNGFSPALADQLYSQGDLFLMPSSFEPCGISQLLAMRAGQPCLVNRVGGLKDTVAHLETGFCFEGHDEHSQAEAMLNCFKDSLALFKNDKTAFEKIAQNAEAVRFSWDSVISEYKAKLYN